MALGRERRLPPAVSHAIGRAAVAFPVLADLAPPEPVESRGAVFDALTAGLPLNGNGCPIIDATVGGVLRDALTTTVQTDDFFDTLNTLAIVVEADPDLFTDATNTLFTVYASTHVAN